MENNTVEAIMSLPAGVFQPYSGVKTSVIFFKKDGSTRDVLFLNVENDGYRVDANHDSPIESDDLPELIQVYKNLKVSRENWLARDKEGWDQKWWFTDVDDLRKNDFNLSAGKYRPHNMAVTSHKDPSEIIEEIIALENGIVSTLDNLKLRLASK